MTGTPAGSEPDALRRLLLLIVLLGAVGLAAELVLLEHYDEWTQWLPLAVLALVIAAASALWLRPRRATIQAFRAVMAIALATGILGLVLHFDGNRAFELEMDGALRGWPLTWLALRGATPTLAPGALVQLALIGLALTWRHPASNHETRIED
jgi:hypothetical protein